MRYPEELIEEVRMQNDIVNVISGYVRLTRKGSSYFGLCPFHNEKSPSFSVSPGKQMYYCFGCGAGGNVFTFLMEYESFTFVEAVKNLAQRAGIALPELEYSREEQLKADKKSVIMEMNKLAANYFYKQLQSANGVRAKQYFLERGLSEKTIKHFGLGFSNIYSDDLYQYLRQKGYKDNGLLKESGLVREDKKHGVLTDAFWNRVMFPIMDINNRVIGFGGRVMGEGQPKYLNTNETLVFDKSRNLYGLNFARTAREDYILVCEGYMDVIAMQQAGFTNAVASLGTAFTSGHARLLGRYVKEVILVYDSDGAGTKAALRAIPILREAGIRTRVLNMEPYKDPDEFIKNLGADKFRERIVQAQNSFLFEVQVLEKEYQMEDPESRNSFYKAVAAKLLVFREELERETYLETIAKLYHIEAKQLRSLVTSVSLTMSGETPVNKPKSGIQKKTKKEDGRLYSQRLLLTWLIEDPALFDKIVPYIQAEDFTEGCYRTVAHMLYEQWEKKELNPARIISRFAGEEEQKEVAALFNTELKEITTKEEKEKALSETVYKIKENSIRYASEHLDPTDLEGLQRIVNGRKELQNLRRLHIFLD
ncbi:MAG: DNA primase [Lachnospiraceae bacterium]|nr:DNA primase [Lachnospiraceae bacterium]